MIFLRHETQRLVSRLIMLAACYLMGSLYNPLKIGHILILYMPVHFTY